jgi:hypothetical protein
MKDCTHALRATFRAACFLVTLAAAVGVCAAAERHARSPDGKREVVETSEKESDLVLWELPGEKVICVLYGQNRREVCRQCLFSPDGRILATVHIGWSFTENAVYLWDPAAGRRIRRIGGRKSDEERGPDENLQPVGFSPDGLLLVTVNRYTLTLAWWETATGQKVHSARLPDGASFGDPRTSFNVGLGGCVTGRVLDGAGPLVPGELPASDQTPRRATPTELAGWWDDLAGEDAPRAYRAVAELFRRGEADFLNRRLTPARPVPAERVRRLLSDLASPEFAVREAASEELAPLADGVEPALREAVAAGPSLELRRRLEALLAPLERRPLVLSQEELRGVRALLVLERLGTDEAREALRAAAGGAPPAFLTRRARAALDRLEAGREPRRVSYASVTK